MCGQSRNRRWLLAAVMALAVARVTDACGPHFPNRLLLMGDGAVLEAPVASFHLEIARIRPGVAYSFSANPPDPAKTHAQQTQDADLFELREALRGVHRPGEILAAYTAKRHQVRAYLDARHAWLANRRYETIHGEPVLVPVGDPPTPPLLELPARLPAEFAHYLTGALAYHHGRLDEARDAWSMLLTLPESQRRLRSTWAAFMIAKSWLPTEPSRAIEWFQRVRTLEANGFADSLGLASSSLGWEARAELTLGHIEKATELYLAQLATGDATASVSLREVARRAYTADESRLRRFAQHRASRHVFTAYLISRHEDHRKPMNAWLEAVEAVAAADVEGADRLAWAAYQAGDADSARRWLNRAREKSPVALWVKAKLWLRDGKVDQASELLAKLVRHFPGRDDWSGAYKESDASPWRLLSAEDEVTGELGVLRLARGQYEEGLDLLLRGGYWVDAAYVAERVLAPDELIAYVDRSWPATESVAGNRERWAIWDSTNRACAATEIRDLLGRRLVRLGRFSEARAYLGSEARPRMEAFARALRSGRDGNQPVARRAAQLWEAAKIARYYGREIMATEVEPDWMVFGGGFDLGDTADDRRGNERLVPVSEEEKRRAAVHGGGIHRRYHYLFRAADLAWEAAGLMPDQTDATARVLCEAGTWIKYRDPREADRFYKALVRRCRQTELGGEADRRRWFPRISEPEQPRMSP